MGLRVRLKATYDTSGFSPQARVIAEALKHYGMILADNGSPWYVTGASDPRFDDDVLHQLDVIKGSRPRGRGHHRAGQRPVAATGAPAIAHHGPMTDIRARALAGETLLGVFLDLGSPLSAEICGRAGYDWVLIDLEHGAATEASLLAAPARRRGHAGRRARPRRSPASGCASAAPSTSGAEGVMVPRLDTADQVREAVGYLRYPPAGGRGVALRTRGAGLGSRGHDQVGEVNERTLGIIQIESATAVAEVDHIAAIDGVDVLFVGPTDLSHSLGVPGQVRRPDLPRRARHGGGRLRPARQVGRASCSTTPP